MGVGLAPQKLRDRGACPLREQKPQEEPREAQPGGQGHKRPYKSGKVQPG